MRGHAVTVAAALVAAVLFGGSLIISGGQPPSLGGDTVRVNALTRTAASLTSGSEVRIAGLQVGRVAGVQRRGDAAVLALDVDADQAPLPRDTRFDVRLRSLVGENYVELYPGRETADLPDGATLPVSAQREDFVELEQVLDQLRGRARARARTLLQQLGTGLAGRGDEVNAVLADGAPALERLAIVMETLNAQRGAVARLIDDVGIIGREVGARGEDLRTLAARGRTAFSAIADRDDALRATLEALPPALNEIRSTSGTLRSVTAGASPVIADLAAAVRDLDPAITALRPAATEGRALLGALDVAAPRLTGTLARVRRIAGPAAAALPALRGALCEANPLLRYLEPYTKNVTSFAQNLASATNFYDANGHAARLLLLAGENGIAPLTPGVADALSSLLDAGVFGELNSRGYQPFARPDDVSPPKTGDGATGPRSYPGTYPRVEADC